MENGKWKKTSAVIRIIKDKIFDKSFMERYRTDERYFTRNRKITFPQIILIQMNMIKRSLQKELVHFFNLTKSPGPISKSAFCQRRS